jgi:hypothetical protein
MAKSTAKPKSNLPINYEEQLAAEAAEISKRISAPSGDRIRYNGNVAFITPDGFEGKELEVVIVDFMSSNMFYEDQYDRDNPAPPTCFAIGPEPSLLVPSQNSPSAQADTCTSCPNNQFGSKGKGKACKNTRLLALMPATALEDSDEEAPLWIMSIPPTSLKAFDSYVQTLASRHKTVPIGVITKVYLDSSNAFASPRFSVVRPLTGDEFPVFMERRNDAQTRLTAEPDTTRANAPKATARRGR